jgi:hypothetical protein
MADSIPRRIVDSVNPNPNFERAEPESLVLRVPNHPTPRSIGRQSSRVGKENSPLWMQFDAACNLFTAPSMLGKKSILPDAVCFLMNGYSQVLSLWPVVLVLFGSFLLYYWVSWFSLQAFTTRYGHHR